MCYNQGLTMSEGFYGNEHFYTKHFQDMKELVVTTLESSIEIENGIE